MTARTIQPRRPKAAHPARRDDDRIEQDLKEIDGPPEVEAELGPARQPLEEALERGCRLADAGDPSAVGRHPETALRESLTQEEVLGQ